LKKENRFLKENDFRRKAQGAGLKVKAVKQGISYGETVTEGIDESEFFTSPDLFSPCAVRRMPCAK